jgi:GMP reductase
MEIFDYDNILLLPRKCRVESRSECDASVELGGRRFRLPVVPANMKTVVDERICEWMAKNGYFYVMHRFDLDNVQFVRDMHAKGCYASISLGVKQPDYDTVDQLVAEPRPGARIHHHRHRPRPCRQREEHDRLPQAKAAAILRDCRQRGHARGRDRPGKLGRRRHQGGRGPGQGVHHQAQDRFWHRRLAAQRAQVVRPRGHQAHHCRRRHPQPWRHCQEHPLWRHHGDDRLAVCGHEESPGKTVEVDGELFKEYYGSASDFNKGEYKHVEGKRILEPIKGKLANTLIEMEQDVQSSISYAGGTKLMDIRKVNYVILGGDNAGEHLLM